VNDTCILFYSTIVCVRVLNRENEDFFIINKSNLYIKYNLTLLNFFLSSVTESLNENT